MNLIGNLLHSGDDFISIQRMRLVTNIVQSFQQNDMRYTRLTKHIRIQSGECIRTIYWRIAQNFITRNTRSEEHTSELQSRFDLVCRLLLVKKHIVLTSDSRSRMTCDSASTGPESSPIALLSRAFL